MMELEEYKIKKIKKRDGRIVDFNPIKIAEAIWKAAKAVGGRDRELSNRLALQVVKSLEKRLEPDEIPSVEQVQDVVETILIENGHARTAKARAVSFCKIENVTKLMNNYFPPLCLLNVTLCYHTKCLCVS